MPIDTTAEGNSATATRRLVIVNGTAQDQNFGLLARPGPLDIIPDVGAERMLAWKVAFVPGRSEAATSRGHFTWVERCTLVLGRFAQTDGFLAEVSLPPPATFGTVAVGFVGMPNNGAAKFLGIGAGSAPVLGLRTDGSFPPTEARGGSTRHLAFAAAIDPDGEGDGAATAFPLGPNMAVSFEPAPRYWITPLAGSTAVGDPILPELATAAHPLVFGESSTLRLAFTERNTFDLLP